MLHGAMMQVDVVPSMAGDACLGLAFGLQHSCIDVTHASPISRRNASLDPARQALPVYLHERGHALVSEDHYLIQGMPANISHGPCLSSLAMSRSVLFTHQAIVALRMRYCICAHVAAAIRIVLSQLTVLLT